MRNRDDLGIAVAFPVLSVVCLLFLMHHNISKSELYVLLKVILLVLMFWLPLVFFYLYPNHIGRFYYLFWRFVLGVATALLNFGIVYMLLNNSLSTKDILVFFLPVFYMSILGFVNGLRDPGSRYKTTLGKGRFMMGSFYCNTCSRLTRVGSGNGEQLAKAHFAVFFVFYSIALLLVNTKYDVLTIAFVAMSMTALNNYFLFSVHFLDLVYSIRAGFSKKVEF